MIALIVFVSVKAPDAADHDERADPVIPKIANEVEAQVGSRVGATEADVIVNDNFGKTRDFLVRLILGGGVRMIAEISQLPFGVDDAAVGR